MKDRLGSFGDILFGLMLAGIVAAYVPMFSTLIKNGDPQKGIAFFIDVLWIQETPFIQFVAVAALWALQARVISKVFVDHVAFLFGYTMMLLWLFGWAIFESIVPVAMESQGLKTALPSLVTSPSLLLSCSFGTLLILAIGGSSYHWFWLSSFKKYESIRDCSMIAIGLALTWLLGTLSIRVQNPLDLLELIAFALALRLMIAVRVDPWALSVWGTAEERSHQTRVLLAGRILVILFAVAGIALAYSDPLMRSTQVFWLVGVAMLAISVWGLPKQISTVRRIRKDGEESSISSDVE